MTLILGIETSCDETAASVVADGRQVRSNIIASQHALHERFGGVVPEIASRAHIERIAPVVTEALEKAGVTLGELDAIAVGNRPGLIGSLLVGVAAAKSLAWALGRPLVGVDHVQAHLYAAAMTGDQPPRYPALGLVVSGGHSSLYLVQSPLQMRLLGRTIDDAVGEAYDKAAVILELGYPGGPKLDKAAQQGDPDRYTLPRSLLGSESLDFSFSGLKTALLYTVRGKPRGKDAHGKARFEHSAADLTDHQRLDLAAAFQHAAIDTLILKIQRAIHQLREQAIDPKSLLVGGGVSANSLLRQRVLELREQFSLDVRVPEMRLCLDNAAMIAGLAHHRLADGQQDDLHLPAHATTDLR